MTADSDFSSVPVVSSVSLVPKCPPERLLQRTTNLLSDVVRCGASQKKPTKDSTLTYSLGWFTFSDVPQIAAYHNKLQTLELNCKVTHQLSLPYDLHTASDLVTTIVYVLKRCSDNVHVVVSV